MLHCKLSLMIINVKKLVAVRVESYDVEKEAFIVLPFYLFD